MADFFVRGRDAILGSGYRQVVKPLAFRFDAELVHDRISGLGQMLGRWPLTRQLTRAMFDYDHPLLRTTLAGVALKNPIGLSAGFDKEGRLSDIMPAVGFGFMEIGSITGSPSPGNPKPRLWRLPKSQAIVVHFGLNSSGSQAVADRLRHREFRLPVAVSIAKANLPTMDTVTEGIGDYLQAATNLCQIGQWLVINISCPNTSGGEPFADPKNLDALLAALEPVVRHRPVFIKLPVDLPWAQLDGLIAVAERHEVTGFTCTNLAKDRDPGLITDAVVPSQGSISGKVMEARSNEVLAQVYRRTAGRRPLVGVGGIFTAADAYRKIRLGASAVQLITGLIYRGPSAISDIKRGLVRLLQRDGLSSLQAAIGLDV